MGIDAQWRRTYARVPLDNVPVTPPTPLTVASEQPVQLAPPGVVQLTQLGATVSQPVPVSSDNEDRRRHIACVITGTVAALTSSGGLEPALRPDHF